MKFYIARQPIFDRQRRLFAYELLYRGAEEVTLTNIDGERATTSLLSSTFFTEGIELISGKKRCFVNFTEDLLLKKYPFPFLKSKLS